MSRRRAIILGLVVLVLLSAAYMLATPLSFLAWMASEAMFPERISWDGKTAWKRCESAIAGHTTWPAMPEAACAAMHLCANEAPLSEQQVDALTQKIRQTPGCQAP